jgi:TATA-box binding protein (TBP) (component of TFIID and TFIIIB)
VHFRYIQSEKLSIIEAESQEKIEFGGAVFIKIKRTLEMVSYNNMNFKIQNIVKLANLANINI